MSKNTYSWIMIIVCCMFAFGCAKKNKITETAVPTEVVAVETAPSEAAVAVQSNMSNISVGNDQLGMKTIYFAFDSYVLSDESKLTLQANADWLKAHPSTNLVIEGNCDERGSDVYNMALGENRARAASNYLVSIGVPAESIRIISYGEERPAVMGHDERAWSLNRRDEFKY